MRLSENLRENSGDNEAIPLMAELIFGKNNT